MVSYKNESIKSIKKLKLLQLLDSVLTFGAVVFTV